MTTNSNIERALRILYYRDWAWEMADDNFMGRLHAAKAEMRDFVETVNRIEDAEVREGLRRYWALRHESLHCAYDGKEFTHKEELDALRNRFPLAS